MDGVEFLVLGSRGLVGSATCRNLQRRQVSYFAASRKDVNILDKESITGLIKRTNPRFIIAAAAKVGGMMANYTFPVEFLSENILAQTYLMEAAHRFDVEKVVFLGSSCIYPKDSPQPISEDSLLTGPLEITNEAYAIAKIAGVKLIQGYRREYGRRWISVMPTNLYGLNDNFDLKTSHALPALMRKFHDAKSEGRRNVELWGTGNPRREFMFSDDFASALMYVTDNYDDEVPINIGTGSDVSIMELAVLMREIVGFDGEINWNASIPDGTYRKLLDVSKLHNMGWKHTHSLREGLEITYKWFKDNYSETRLHVEI